MTTVTKDDVGKAVETAAGEHVGVVTAVDRETAYVKPDPELTDSVRATLGWETEPADAVPVVDTAVREIRDDAVVLAETVPEDAFVSESGDESPETGRTDV